MQPKSCSGDAGEPRDQAVGDPRRDLARDEGVLAVLPPARDDVVAARRARSSSRGMSAGSFWRSPSIGMRISPRARSSAADKRGGLAAVAPQEDDPHVLGVAPLDRLELRGRAVGRAVVDEDQLVAHGQRPQDRVELGVQRLDVVDLVEDRDQDRQVDRSSSRRSSVWLTWPIIGDGRTLERCTVSRSERPRPLNRCSTGAGSGG